MKFSIPSQGKTITITSDNITTEFDNGEQYSIPITPEFKRNAGDATAIAGGAVSSGVGLGLASSIASLAQ